MTPDQYRNKQFLSFVFTQRVPPFLWFSALALTIGATVAFFSPGNNLSGSTFGLAGLGFLVQAFFIYRTAFKHYTNGHAVLQAYDAAKVDIITGVPVLVQDFDMWNVVDKIPKSASKTLYTFEEADFALTPDALVIMGYARQMGVLVYAAPAKIFIGEDGQNHSHMLEWSEADDQLTIAFIDADYKNPIKIILGAQTAEVKNWLAVHVKAATAVA